MAAFVRKLCSFYCSGLSPEQVDKLIIQVVEKSHTRLNGEVKRYKQTITIMTDERWELIQQIKQLQADLIRYRMGSQDGN